jgi:hypothetical protein
MGPMFPSANSTRMAGALRDDVDVITLHPGTRARRRRAIRSHVPASRVFALLTSRPGQG